MTDEEYVARLGFLYHNILKARPADDYRINQPQLDKFVELLDFFLERAKALGGMIEPVQLCAPVTTGDLNAKFIVFDINGELVQKFCKVISYCSAVSIDATNDRQVYISCTVPKVYVPIDMKFEDVNIEESEDDLPEL